MKTTVFTTAKELADAAASTIEDVIKNKPDALVCLCAGESPIPVMRKLVEDAKAGEYPAGHFKFVSLDEWVGLGKLDSGSCIHDVSKHFLDPLEIKNDRLFFFDGLSDDLSNECAKAEQFIDLCGGIDVILLGIGLNGHIGFNEPGSKIDEGARVVELSEKSKEVSVKYFNHGFRPKKGITIGIKQIMEAKKVILIAYDAHKQDIVYETVFGKVSQSCPSTYMRDHPDAELMVDDEAAKKIRGNKFV